MGWLARNAQRADAQEPNPTLTHRVTSLLFALRHLRIQVVGLGRGGAEGVSIGEDVADGEGRGAVVLEHVQGRVGAGHAGGVRDPALDLDACTVSEVADRA